MDSPSPRGVTLLGYNTTRERGDDLEHQSPFFRFDSNKLKIRLYSSAQLVGCTKPWSSTGYIATDQFSLRNSISRCTRRTESWKNTLVSTMPWQISSAPLRFCA